MELRVLRYFLMVAREENITKAAHALHVTQPTLSRQMAQLEEELGAKLFNRKSHNIELTEEGVLLRRRAQEIMQLSEIIKDELSGSGEELSGKVAIGAGELKSMDQLADIIAEFHEVYPKVEFELYSGNVQGIKFQMDQGLLDLGLLIEPVEIEKYDFLRMTQAERWGALIPDNNKLAKLSAITASDLKNQPLIVSKSSSMRSELKSWFGDFGQELNIVNTYNLLYNSAMLMRKNVGIGLSLELHSQYEGLTFIPLEPELKLTSVLVWKSNQVFSPATTKFIDFSKKYLKSIS
ncbi:LysR family transcriptional regulator [Enterococcus faecalis]|uniref:LysR family transcriptional regulator n=1 Tax=Enterococcus faecalis TaxID=1351 RepID=UPI001AD7540D|nr:LysR family transcriptional regulator [Enterococcus faecalis]MBO6438773.1 LysR family transcriptional regulator [Enterococcus faecalis]MBO6453338.1 LysR family transcriptional regulator [Enterococcus faecalis]